MKAPAVTPSEDARERGMRKDGKDTQSNKGRKRERAWERQGRTRKTTLQSTLQAQAQHTLSEGHTTPQSLQRTRVGVSSFSRVCSSGSRVFTSSSADRPSHHRSPDSASERSPVARLLGAPRERHPTLPCPLLLSAVESGIARASRA
eukprot:3043108-Rhodomonas_salina.1